MVRSTNMAIPGSSAATPTGLAGVLAQQTFEAADSAQQAMMLEVLLAADNPEQHAPGTVPCIACHASTVLLEGRSMAAGIDPLSLRGGYVTRITSQSTPAIWPAPRARCARSGTSTRLR